MDVYYILCNMVPDGRLNFTRQNGQSLVFMILVLAALAALPGRIRFRLILVRDRATEITVDCAACTMEVENTDYGTSPILLTLYAKLRIFLFNALCLVSLA